MSNFHALDDTQLVDLFAALVIREANAGNLDMSSGTVRVRGEILRRMAARTGDATATGGGFANTGIVRR